NPAAMKRGLSKNLLRMKFMQASAMEAEKQQSLADRVITSEEWRYEPELLSGLPNPAPLSGAVSRPDYVPSGAPGAPSLQPASWGRVSYGGFNPAIERLMAAGQHGGVASDAALEAESSATVSAEQMRQRRQQRSAEGGGLASSIGKSFETKRARKRRLLAEKEKEATAPAAEVESPEEGELPQGVQATNANEDEATAEMRLQRKRMRKLKKKWQQKQQSEQSQQQAGLRKKKNKESPQQTRRQQQQQSVGKKQNKQGKAAQAILPHPSTIQQSRKRKAEAD
ncbi:hypothetical protein BOX15_Mlig005706g3, partial [Macrostomum lignano]